MLTDLLEKLANAPDLNEEELIYAQIRELAEADRSSFIQEVRTLPVEDGSSLEEIYEALSAKPLAWQSFYLEEFDRLLALARERVDPRAVLEALDTFYLLSLDDEAPQLKQALRNKLMTNVDDDNVNIRRKCTVLLADFTGGNDFKALDLLERLAGEDPDWRVRYYAWEALEDSSPDRAKRVTLPLSVRLKVRFSNIKYE